MNQTQLPEDQLFAIARKHFGWVAGLGGFEDAVKDFVADLSAALAAAPSVPVSSNPVPVSSNPPVAYLHLPHEHMKDRVRPVASTTKYNEPHVYAEVLPLYAAAPEAPQQDDAKDAARYRFWRELYANDDKAYSNELALASTEADVDRAIDAAMQENP